MTTHRLGDLLGGQVRSAITTAITEHPRSLQTRIGPSESGTTCTACLVSKLAGLPAAKGMPGWLPTIGTAVHTWLADVFLDLNADRHPAEWLIEHTVTVGQIGGVDITGSADLYHIPTGTVLDWKIVGNTAIQDTAKGKVKDVYNVQRHCYGKGFAARGYDVRQVGIVYLPRNHRNLDYGVVDIVDYDPAVADTALRRANDWHAVIGQLGPQTALAAAGPHNGAEFSCEDYEPRQPAASPLTLLG